MTAATASLPATDGFVAPPNLKARKAADNLFTFWGIVATAIGLGVLVALIWDLLSRGGQLINWSFLTTIYKASALEGTGIGQIGVAQALMGSLLLMITVALIAIPVGVAAGVYLEEYAPKNAITNTIEIAVNNLAGVPSIVYGLLGLALFVPYLRPPGFEQVTLLAGAMTLALLILPIIIVASREAARAVPQAVRDAALALGATKLQTVSHHVVPYAVPGIVTGVIIALSRAFGETAPLIVLGVKTSQEFLPVALPGEVRPSPVQPANLDPTTLTTPDAIAGYFNYKQTITAVGQTTLSLPGDPATGGQGFLLELPAGESFTAPAQMGLNLSFVDPVTMADTVVRLDPGQTFVSSFAQKIYPVANFDQTSVVLAPGQSFEAPVGTIATTTFDQASALRTWVPDQWMLNDFTAMPLQMFNWTSQGGDFLPLAAAAGLVLLLATLLMNGVAIWLRYRLRQRIKW